jgi:hypothetical protein
VATFFLALLSTLFFYDRLVSHIGSIILRRSVDLGSSMRGRRTSSSLHVEVISFLNIFFNIKISML